MQLSATCLDPDEPSGCYIQKVHCPLSSTYLRQRRAEEGGHNSTGHSYGPAERCGFMIWMFVLRIVYSGSGSKVVCCLPSPSLSPPPLSPSAGIVHDGHLMTNIQLGTLPANHTQRHQPTDSSIHTWARQSTSAQHTNPAWDTIAQPKINSRAYTYFPRKGKRP